MNTQHRKIIETIASDIGVSIESVLSGVQRRRTVAARSMMAYALVTISGFSGPEAATTLGLKCHTSVYSARDRVRTGFYDKYMESGTAADYVRGVVDRVREDAA